MNATDRPAQIYLVEERRGSSKEGPWGDWQVEPLPKGAICPRPRTTPNPITEEQGKPTCQGIGGPKGPLQEFWRQLRTVPYELNDELDAALAWALKKGVNFHEGHVGLLARYDENGGHTYAHEQHDGTGPAFRAALVRLYKRSKVWW